METLHSLLEAEFTQRLGWTLVHFLWQAAIIGIITAIILGFTKKISANTRYRIAFSSLYIMVLISLITFKSITLEKPGIDNTKTTDIVQIEIADAEAVDIPTNDIVEQQQVPAEITPEINKEFELEALLPYITLCWLGGISTLSILHIGGWFQLQKLRWQTVKPVAESVKSQMNAYAKTLGISRAVNILESSLVQVPTVIGHFKPIILMPASIITGISSDQIASLLAHELAHIKRNDYLANIIQTAFEIMGFFHPAVWWLSRKIRTERENCCDDIAITATGNKIEYAKALTAMEEMRSQQYKLAVAASGGSLYCRIRRLLIEDKNNERKTSGIYSAVATLLIMGIIIPCAFALAKTEKINTLSTNDINSIVRQIDIDNETPADLVKMLGEPIKYAWDGERFAKDNLPARYAMFYPNNLNVFVKNDYIVELRLEDKTDYVSDDGLKYGMNLEDTINILGEPKEIVSDKNEYKANTLYKDIRGYKGYCYYHRQDKNIRIWFWDNKISSIYLTRSDFNGRGDSKNKYTIDNLPKGSHIDEKGYLVDKVDYPFENDPDVIGKWTSVDFVNNVRTFMPSRKNWGGDLFLKYMRFYDSGAAYLKFKSDNNTSGGGASIGWTKGLLLGGNKASKYTIKEIEGEKYMFYEWKSGDYTFRHMHPSYYVLKQDFSPASETPVTTTVYMVSSIEPLPQFKNLPVQNNIMGDDINKLLDEIRNNKNAKILSTPSVTSPDGQTAKINTIHEVQVKDADGNATPMDLGIKLSMTNNIQDGGTIHSLVDFNFNYLVDNNSTKVTHINTQVNLMPDFYIAIYCGKDADGNHLTEIINTKIASVTDNLTPNSTATAMTSSRFVNTIPPGGMGGGITPANLKLDASDNANTQTNLPDIATNIRIITFPVDLPQANNLKFGGLLNIPPDKIDELLKSILNNPESKLLSAPKIVSHNGEKATLTLADNVPIPKTDGSGQFDYTDIGLNVSITNTVKDNNNIQSQISITRTELNGTSVSSNAAATDILIPEGQTAVISGGQTSDGKYNAILVSPETTTLPVQPTAIKLGSKQSGGMGGGMMGNFVGGIGGMTGAAGSIQLNDISGPSVKTEVRIATIPNDPVQLKEIMQNPIIDDARAKEIISLTKKDSRSRLLTMPYCSIPDNFRSNFSFGETKLFITNHIISDKNMVRTDIEYGKNESGPDGIMDVNSTTTSLAIPSGKTCIVSGYNTADYATLLLIKVTINKAEETAKKESDNLEVVKIEFVPNVEMKQITQGKNVLYLNVKNNSDKDQLFAVHIYTRSPDMGLDGIGWGTVFFETIPAKQTKQVKAPFKIQGPVTENTFVRLKYYNPASEEQYDYEKPFHEDKLNAAKINAVFANDRTPGTLSKNEPVSKELTETLQKFQDLIRNKAYDKAWDMLTDDYQVSEYQRKGLEQFRKHMEPVHPLDDGFSWKKDTFLNMKPTSMIIRGQAAFQNKAYVYIEAENEKWTIVFSHDESSRWKIDDITGYSPNVVNM